MNQYDINKKGKLLSYGSEHIVYNYDADKIIKFSLVHFFYGRIKGLEWAQKELELSKVYFGNFLLDTEIVLSPNQRYHAIVQPKIIGHYLTAKDLENEFIYKQFQNIITSYRHMCADGKPVIDLIGQLGVFKNCMSNIFVLNNNQLVIIDATLFNSKCPFIIRPLIAFLRCLVLPIQNRRINQFLAENGSRIN